MFKNLCSFFALVAMASCVILREERCDNQDLQLTCFESRIDIVKVTYGRWKSKQCAPSSIVNCYSTAAEGAVKSLCQNRETCSITVKPQTLGDNCPTVKKALEVHYQCVSSPVYPPASPPPQQPIYSQPQQPAQQPKYQQQYPQQNPPSQQTYVAPQSGQHDEQARYTSRSG